MNKIIVIIEKVIEEVTEEVTKTAFTMNFNE